ncbi:hypothetical protein [Nocardiopsis nanhaiensis]
MGELVHGDVLEEVSPGSGTQGIEHHGVVVEAFQSAWLGETVAWENWVSLGASTVIGAGVAAALFRWE